jgi:hypothetical protein
VRDRLAERIDRDLELPWGRRISVIGGVRANAVGSGAVTAINQFSGSYRCVAVLPRVRGRR